MGILGKNYLHTVVSNFTLKFVIGLIISVVTARALGPDGRGEYNLFMLIIITVMVLFNFGIPASNTYFTAQRKYSRAQLFKASFLLSLLVTAASFLVLFLVYHFDLIDFFFPSRQLTPMMVASLGIIPVVFFNLFTQAILQIIFPGCY